MIPGKYETKKKDPLRPMRVKSSLEIQCLVDEWADDLDDCLKDALKSSNSTKFRGAGRARIYELLLIAAYADFIQLEEPRDRKAFLKEIHDVAQEVIGGRRKSDLKAAKDRRQKEELGKSV